MKRKKIDIKIDTEATPDSEIYNAVKNFLTEHFQNWEFWFSGDFEGGEESRRHPKQPEEKEEVKEDAKEDKQGKL